MVTPDILEIARRLGAKLRRVTASEWVGPCPKCGGRDRFGVNVQRLIWNCRNCSRGGDAIELARHVLGVSYREALAFIGDGREIIAPRHAQESHWHEPAKHPADVAPEPDKIAQALALWRGAADPRGTLVERYLNKRALHLEDDLAEEVVRWHSATGAMIALLRSIVSGEPQAVSRRFLDPNGAALGKPKFLGPVKSAAIMLDGFADVTLGLHIGEGFETCLAARQLGLKPTWAVGSKGAIAAFPILAGIETLTVLEEPDAAAEVDICASRWHDAGREVYLNRAIGGKDLNDTIRSAA